MLFKVENPEDFIQKNVSNNQYFIETYKYHNPETGRERDAYIFLKEKYYFMLYQDKEGTFAFKPMYSGYIKQDVTLFFPFFDYQYFWEEYDETTFSWETIEQLNSFEDVADFYKGIDENYYTIIENEKKIIIDHVVPNYYLNDASFQYQIILNCLDEGINIEVKINDDI